MKKLLWFLSDVWFPIVLALLVVIIVALVAIDITKQNRQKAEWLSFCQEADYIGMQCIDQHPVCYGYIKGNQLVTVPIADLKSGQ